MSAQRLLVRLTMAWLLAAAGCSQLTEPDDDVAGDSDTTGDDDSGRGGNSVSDDDDSSGDDDASSVDADSDGDPASTDCDDSNPARSTLHAEVPCDGVDNDCSPASSDTVDADADGESCGGDCDDANPDNFSGNPETCDGVDNDCDGTTWAAGGESDGDGDGALACSDCADGDDSRFPDNPEVMDGVDNDCDGLVDGDDPDLNGIVGPAGMFLGALPAGSFTMGCTAGEFSCDANEVPARTVTLTRGFWLGETEVTQGQWQTLVGNNPSFFGPNSPGADCGADCPVDSVNWYEALAFANLASIAAGLPTCYVLGTCSSTMGNDLECPGITVATPSGSPLDCEGYRLPTEAEWEYAARAGTDLLYAGSNMVGAVAWYIGDGVSTTHPVATKSPNSWGMYDMSGNVWEWTWDWYDAWYYASASAIDPEGPAVGSDRVRRGGGWISTSSVCEAVHRYGLGPDELGSAGGFRLARTIP